MKILMLGWELPPLNSGGLGVACYYLCRHLADAGVAIDFVMPYSLPSEHQPDFMRVYSSAPDHTKSLQVTGPYACWSADLRAEQNRYKRTVQKLIADNRYNAIHAHDWLTFEAAMHAKKTTGAPLIAHVHSTEFDRAGNLQGGNPLVHDIEYNCLVAADRIVAVSKATKQLLVQKYNLPPGSIDVVYNAANPRSFEQTSFANAYVYLQKMKQRGYKVVVSLGRLTIQKGLYYLLQAAKQALQKNPKLLFLIAGDGEQRNELISLSAELGIAENVIFTGFVRGKEWRDAYEVADMFVMSSVSEPFGLTALEAAGTGTAVLLTHQTGASEVLANALRFDFWDANRLADYILNVAAQDVLRDTLATNAQREVTAMTWGKATSQISHLYRTLAGATA